jgi:hypothetical protein
MDYNHPHPSPLLEGEGIGVYELPPEGEKNLSRLSGYTRFTACRGRLIKSGMTEERPHAF